MAGRHDKAGDDASATGLLLTGPIAVRGLSKSVRAVLRPNRESRHRAGESSSDPDGVADVRTPAGDFDRHGDSAHEAESGPGDADGAASAAGEERVVTGGTTGEPDERDGADAPASERSTEHTRDGVEQDGVARDGSVEPAESAEPAERAGRPRVPLRERLGRETIGVAVLVVLALVCAGLVTAVVVKTRNDAATAAREAARYTPPPLTTAGPGADAPVIAVIGDAATTRAASGVAASQRWPALIGEALDGNVEVDGGSGAGYTAEGSDGATFVDAAAQVPEDADVVMFVGGAADAGATSLELATAATKAFSVAVDRAPGAAVIAVGPLFVPSDVDDLDGVRTTLRSSAGIADVRWLDPVRSEWLRGIDGTADLTAAAERTIASRLRPAVESAAG